GWTTAVSLTTTDVYACGTILYPVLDLTGWSTGGTHDFESHYLESLIGPRAEVPARYEERSPIAHAEKLTVPFLLLQGLDDVICPPAQCERFLARLAGRQVPHAYLTFPGEGHGFRRAGTMVRALEAELSLYTQGFGLGAPDAAALELTGWATSSASAGRPGSPPARGWPSAPPAGRSPRRASGPVWTCCAAGASIRSWPPTSWTGTTPSAIWRAPTPTGRPTSRPPGATPPWTR